MEPSTYEDGHENIGLRVRQGIDLNRRSLLVGGLAIVAAGASLLLSPHRRLGLAHGVKIADAIPLEIGKWQSAAQGDFVLAPEDEMRAAAIYQTVLTRNYADGAHPDVMLMIAYDETQSTLLHIHRPENCYPAAGFQIAGNGHRKINVGIHHDIEAKFMTARSPLRTEQVLYWSRIGDKFPMSSIELELALIEMNLAGYVPDGALVRLSTLTSDPGEGLEAMMQFAQELFKGADQQGRALLLGPFMASALAGKD